MSTTANKSTTRVTSMSDLLRACRATVGILDVRRPEPRITELGTFDEQYPEAAMPFDTVDSVTGDIVRVTFVDSVYSEIYDPDWDVVDSDWVVRSGLLGWDAHLWVTAYHVTREYGGPEEGGWWYTHRKPVAIYRVVGQLDGHCDNLERIAQAVRLHHDDDGTADMYSVAPTGPTVRVTMGYVPGDLASVSRPHYC